MPSVPYLTDTPTGSDMNRVIGEFDRRLSVALNGNSPLVPCQRGVGSGNSAALSLLWTDMYDRSHDLLGYRFSFTDGANTPYHDLSAIQIGAWTDYDHAALQAIAAAATPTSQDDSLHIITVTSTADTQKLEGSLEAHTLNATTGPNIGTAYFINVTGRPMRRHTYGVAELVCEGKTSLTVPREWNRFECYRVHNLSGTALVVTVETQDRTGVSISFTVKPYGVKAFRRTPAFIDASLNYFWRWRNQSDRPVFLEASGVTTAGYCIPEQSARANPIARPFGILDWFSHWSLALDPRELPDQTSLFTAFQTPATAAVFGDLIHYRGIVWSIAYPTDTSLAPVIGKGEFKGYSTLVGDFASIGIEATESGGVITLDRASNADGDAANGLDVFAPSSNLLNGSGFHSFRTLPFDLESTASLRWSTSPFTVSTVTSTVTAKTLTDADPVTYSTATATVPRLAVSPLRQSVSHRARAASVATLTTVQAHGYSAGQFVLVYGVGGTGYNGHVEITSVPTTTTFSYASGGANEGTTADSGGTGYVMGTAAQLDLNAAPNPPETDGVNWQGTWRLTPCGWRAAWQYEVSLTSPGLLLDAENASTDGLLDSIYDDITANGIAIHRGQVAVVDQGWPLDTAATVFNAGTGSPHSLTPSNSRRYGVQSTDGTIGSYDPAFSGYLGSADGADLQAEDKEVETFSGLKSLKALTFRRNPQTLAATHKLAEFADSAYVPLLQESVALSDAESIFTLRADLAAETAEVAAIDPAYAFHILPLLAHHHNLLAWHVNAWTRSRPLCTVMDVLIGMLYDAFLAEDVYFSLASLSLVGIPVTNYSDGVAGVTLGVGGFGHVPSKWVVNTISSNGTDYGPTLSGIGFTVETEADAAGAALIATADSATPTTFCVEIEPFLIETLTPTPPDTVYYGLYGQDFASITPPGTPSTTHTDFEQDIRDEMSFELSLYTDWISADSIKAWANDRNLLFVYESTGRPLKITAEDADDNEILIPSSVYQVGETSWELPDAWDSGIFPDPNREEFEYCPKFVRWMIQTTPENVTWLNHDTDPDRYYLNPEDEVWESNNTGTGEGGQDLAVSGYYVINLTDNPVGGIGLGSPIVGATANFPSATAPVNGPNSIEPGILTDGRPANVRANDRGTFQTFAVVNVSCDPTGKLVTNSRLVAYKSYDLSFDSSWLLEDVDNATMGHNAIPRTLTSGDGSILTAGAQKNDVAIIDPGSHTGIWKMDERRNVYMDLR